MYFMTSIRRITDGKQDRLQGIRNRLHAVPPVILQILEESSVVGIGQVLDERTLSALRAIPWTLRNQGVPTERAGPERIHLASCTGEVSFQCSNSHMTYSLNKCILPFQEGFQSGVQLKGRLLETGIPILRPFHTRNINVTLFINLNGKPHIHSLHNHRYRGIILVRYNHKTIPSK